MVKSRLRRQLLIRYDDVFPGEIPNLSDLLKGLDRSKFLRNIAFLLRQKVSGGKFSDYRNLLHMFFSPENDGFYRMVRQKLDFLAATETPDLVIIQPITCLQLFEHAFDLLEDNPDEISSAAEIRVFKAILLLNQENADLQSKGGPAKEQFSTLMQIAAMSLASTFPYSEFINYDPAELHAGQMVKSILLFEWLESHEETKPLLEGFVNHYGCGDWKNFLRYLMPLGIKIIDTDAEQYIDLDFNKAPNSATIEHFMDKLIVHEEATLKDYDFKKLRAAPFYKIGHLRYRVISGVFVLELFHKGVFFTLKEIYDKLPSRPGKKDFRSFYCDEFSEKTLLYTLLTSIYQGKYIQFSGEALKKQGYNAEPDYYLRNGKRLFLFESKDIFINAEIKGSYNWDIYYQEFKNKLHSFVTEDGKVKKKAVLQLVHNIARVLKKEFAFDKNYKSRDLYIYPVLIMHDQQFNVAGLNVLVNRWFQEELQLLKEQGLPTGRVQPVVIINIDSLLFHQDLFRERILRLDEIIDKYFEHVTLKMNSTDRPDQVVSNAERTVLPFSLFLSNYISENGLRRVPKMITEKGLTLVNA